jgi:integrase
MPRYKERYQCGEWFLRQRAKSPAWYRARFNPKTRNTELISLNCTDFEVAKARLNEWWAENFRAQEVDRHPADVKLSEVILDYWVNQGSKLRSAQTVKIMLRYWNDWWGEASVHDVRSPNKQDDFKAHLSGKGLNNTSVCRCLEIGRAAIRRAWKRGVITSFPHVDVPLIGETAPKGRPLSVDEIGKLLRGTDEPHMQLVVLMLLGTAARSEPILTMKWEQVDFEAGLIKLNPDGRVQTSKRRPVVRLPSTLRGVLEPRKGEGRVVMFRGRVVGKIDHGFRNMVKRAELKGHVTPYSLRHTAARWLRMKGVPMEQVAGQLGHTIPSFAMSERYAPHDPAHLAQACAALDELLALVLPAAEQLRDTTEKKRRFASALRAS